jgi:hypothetical protein
VKIQTVDGLVANLDESHWRDHILVNHPELEGMQNWLIETLKQPDNVYRSMRDSTTRIYTRMYQNVQIGNEVISELTLRVFVREAGGFVVTAHFAAATFRNLGERIWPL